MCGRYASTLPPEMMAELFKLLNSIDTLPRYNIAPTQPVVTVREQGHRREAHFARWGLVPGWVKDPREFPLSSTPASSRCSTSRRSAMR